MKTTTFDFETTTSNIGNPFDATNKAVCLAIKLDDAPTECLFYDKMYLPKADLYIAFNAKFDTHWARRLGLPIPKRVWCCQLAEFYLECFTNPYPSLEATCVKYGLPSKLDVVKAQYWDKQIDTDEIPSEILAEYAIQDVDLTYYVYLKQKEQFEKNDLLYTSFKIACMDLLVLQEMEYNGLQYDESICKQKVLEIDEELEKISAKLMAIYPDVPVNFNSTDHLSAFLYGGTIKQEVRTQIGLFKTGSKIGSPRYKVDVVEHQLPRLVNPLPKSNLKKEGLFATDEPTLRKLTGPAAKKYVSLLLRYAELSKLKGTYYEGLPSLNKKMNWPESKLHGQFNQVVAKTGRLSSTKP